MLSGSRGAFPYHRGKQLMAKVELFTFGDESGIHDGARYCVVAGYIGSPRQWKPFEEAWAEVLDRYSVQAFHAVRFFGRGPGGVRLDEYEGWADEKADAFLDELMGVINQRRLRAIGGAIDVKAFKALTQGEKRYVTGGWVTDDGKWLASGAPSKPSAPYFFALLLFLIEALSEAAPDARINLIFDRQNVVKGRAVQNINDLTRHQILDAIGGARLRQVAFAPSDEEQGLQAVTLPHM